MTNYFQYKKIKKMEKCKIKNKKIKNLIVYLKILKLDIFMDIFLNIFYHNNIYIL